MLHAHAIYVGWRTRRAKWSGCGQVEKRRWPCGHDVEQLMADKPFRLAGRLPSNQHDRA